MLQIFGSTHEIDEDVLKGAAKAAFEFLADDFEANLRFVSEAKIKELNRIYRNRDLVTDVLSFKLDPTEAGGDIVICYKEIGRQAKRYGSDRSSVAAFLMVHGILHLANYDHIKTVDRAKMEAAEEKILAKVGIKINGR